MPSITLNLPYDLSEEQWLAVDRVFREMDGWVGHAENDNTPQWYGTASSPKHVWASVEPSGLLIDGNLDQSHWTGWISTLCTRLSLALQCEIRDAEM
jgi:hypothetical protein